MNKKIKPLNVSSDEGYTISSTIDLSTFGECRGYVCPICDYVTKEGDLRSPFVITYGEKICVDCRTKLKKLIGK